MVCISNTFILYIYDNSNDIVSSLSGTRISLEPSAFELTKLRVLAKMILD